VVENGEDEEECRAARLDSWIDSVIGFPTYTATYLQIRFEPLPIPAVRTIQDNPPKHCESNHGSLEVAPLQEILPRLDMECHRPHRGTDPYRPLALSRTPQEDQEATGWQMPVLPGISLHVLPHSPPEKGETLVASASCCPTRDRKGGLSSSQSCLGQEE